MARIQALESQNKPSTATVQKDIIQYALRHVNDFDKYVALEKVERLKHIAAEEKNTKADFFGSVHSTLLDRIQKPTEQFENYVLALLGDREYERIVEAVGKVNKTFTSQHRQ